MSAFGGMSGVPIAMKRAPVTDRSAGELRARRWRMVAGAALALALAACAGKHVPPPPPPPPPLIAVPPPERPVPPDGAATTLVTPIVGADGVRESVNRKVSSNQIVWNLRSAYTVAALDCREPRNVAILTNYRAFLVRNAVVLKAVYDAMDHEFRAKYQRGGETLRDDYLTVLYNHYALPPTKAEFCDVVDQVLQDGANVPADQLEIFATANVPVIEKVFDDFYTRYDKYKNALAAWEEKYGRVGRVSVGQFSQQAPPPPPTAPYHNQVEAVPYRAPYQAPVQASVQAPVLAPDQVAVQPTYQAPVLPAYQAPEQVPIQAQEPPAPMPAPYRAPPPTSQPTQTPTQTTRLPDLLSGPQDGPVANPVSGPVSGPVPGPVSGAPPRPVAGPPSDTP